MAALQDQMSLSALPNNVLKTKNVAKKSTTKTPPGSRPSSRGHSRESSPEQKVVIMNGQNKHHSDLPSLAAQGDISTVGNGSVEARNLKRDVEESGGGDNPAKHARLQINDIEKRQEEMLQTAVGHRRLELGGSQDSIGNGDKDLCNGVESKTINAEPETPAIKEVCMAESMHSIGDVNASGNTSINTDKDSVVDISSNDDSLTTSHNSILKTPAKLSKPSFALGDKAKDTFKEILKAAVSRVSSDAAEKCPGANQEKMYSNTPKGTSSPVIRSSPTKSRQNSTTSHTQSAMLDKGNLFENMSLNFSSHSGDDKYLKSSSRLNDFRELDMKPSSEFGDSVEDKTSVSDSSKPTEPVVNRTSTVEAGTTIMEAAILVKLDSTEEKISPETDENTPVCGKAEVAEHKVTNVDQRKVCDSTKNEGEELRKSVTVEYNVNKEPGTQTPVSNVLDQTTSTVIKEPSNDLHTTKPQSSVETDQSKKIVKDTEKDSTDCDTDELMLLGSADSDENLDIVDDSILDDELKDGQGKSVENQTKHGQLELSACNGFSSEQHDTKMDKVITKDDNNEKLVGLDKSEVADYVVPKLGKKTENPEVAASMDDGSVVEVHSGGSSDDLEFVVSSNDCAKDGDIEINDSYSSCEEESNKRKLSLSSDDDVPCKKVRVDEGSSDVVSVENCLPVSDTHCEHSNSEASVISLDGEDKGNTRTIVEVSDEKNFMPNAKNNDITSEDLKHEKQSDEIHNDNEVKLEDHEDNDVKSEVQKDNDVKSEIHKNNDFKSEVHKDNDVKSEDHKDNDVKSEFHRDNDVKSEFHRDNDVTSKVQKDDVKSEIHEDNDLKSDIKNTERIDIGDKSDDSKSNVKNVLEAEQMDIDGSDVKSEKDVDACDDDSVENDDVLIMEDGSIPSTSEAKQDEKLEPGSDGMLKISRRALERLICQKMETVLASNEHIKLVSDLQNRITKLTLQLNKWKTAAKSYQTDIAEAIRSGRPERRRTARGQVRHVAVQVDEARLTAGKLSSPAKSVVQKTPTRPQGPAVATGTPIAPKPSTLTTSQPAVQTLILPVASASANGTISLLAPPSNLPPASANIASGQYRYAAIQQKPTVREILDTRRTSESSDKTNTGATQISQQGAKPATSGPSEKIIDLTEDDEMPGKAVIAATVPTGQVLIRQGIPTAATSSTNNSGGIRAGTYLVPVSNGPPILLQSLVAPQIRSPLVYSTAPRAPGTPQQILVPSTAGQQVGPGGQQLVTLAAGQSSIRPVVIQPPGTPATVMTKSTITTRAQTGAKASPVSQTGVPSRTAPTRANKHPAPLPPQPVSTKVSPDLKLQPPKPSLKISRVPQGIVLSWNMTSTDNNADVTNYQLFAYQEGSSPPYSSLWKRVGDVKALPLPMACTLTQFHEGNKYHFAVRAVDEHSRIGPFSEPSSIHLEATPKS